MSLPVPFRPVSAGQQGGDGVSDLAQLLTRLSQQNQQIIDSLNQIAELLRTPATVASLQLPMSPSVLNRMLHAVFRGSTAGSAPAIVGLDKFSVSVPAGTTVTGTVPVREGTVTVSTAPILMTATYYHPLITLRAYVDGHELTDPDYPYNLTGEDEIDLGQYYYAFQAMTFEFTNGSATNTVITFRSQGFAMDRNYFQLFYYPMVQYSYRKMAELAERVNGGRPIP